MNKNSFSGADGGAGVFAGAASAAGIRVNDRAGDAAFHVRVNSVIGTVLITDHAVFMVGPRQATLFFYFGDNYWRIVFTFKCRCGG